MIRRQAILGIADQAVCSAANFVGFLLVSKGQDPSSAGVYATYFALLTMTTGIQNALVLGPMRVVGATYVDAQRETYFSRSSGFQFVLAVAVSLSFSAVIGVQGGWEWALGFAATSVAQQFQLYGRAVALTRMDGFAALVSDCIAHGFRLLLLFGLASAGTVSPLEGFLALAAGSFLASLIYRCFGRPSFQKLRMTLQEHWPQGKWLLLETASFYLSTQFYLLMVPALLGIGAAGVFAAMQNLMNITNVATMGVAAAAPSILRRRLLAEGRRAWIKATAVFMAITVGIAGLLVGVTSAFGKELMSTLYGHAYASEADLLALFGVGYVLAGMNAILGAAFRSAERPDAGAMAKGFTAVATILVGPAMIMSLGVRGAVFGLLVTQATWLLIYLVYILNGSLGEKRIEKLRQNALREPRS